MADDEGTITASFQIRVILRSKASDVDAGLSDVPSNSHVEDVVKAALEEDLGLVTASVSSERLDK